MHDIDNDIRNSLERLTSPHGNIPETEALWGDLVDRRRKRRNRNRTLAALPLLLVAVLAVGIFSTQGTDDARSDVAAGGADTSSPDGFDGSWRIAATVNNGERQSATGTANLRFDGEQVQGGDGCNNPIDTTLENGVIVGPSVRTQVGCTGDTATKEADLFWESLGHPLEIRGGELWLVNDQGVGLIFERTDSNENASADPDSVSEGEALAAFGEMVRLAAERTPEAMERLCSLSRLNGCHGLSGGIVRYPESAPGADVPAPVVLCSRGVGDGAWMLVVEGEDGYGRQYVSQVVLDRSDDGSVVPLHEAGFWLGIAYNGTRVTGSTGLTAAYSAQEGVDNPESIQEALRRARASCEAETGENGSANDPEADGTSSLSFEPFTMRYRTTEDTGTEFVWTLDYTSVEEWSMELVSTTSTASGYQVGATQTFKDGKHTIAFGPDEPGQVEERDEPVAPLQVLSRGPIRTFGTLYGQPAEPAVHEGRNGYETTETIDCPPGNTDEVDWCGNPGGQVTLKTFYEFNDDGVPVLVHSYIEGTNPLVWRFEALDYEGKS